MRHLPPAFHRISVGHLAFLVCLLWASMVVAQDAAKRPLEIADFYHALDVGHPMPSPDGKYVVFSVGTKDLERGESWSQLWRLELQSGDTHQLSHLEKNDDSPRYSPDGEHILFESDRDESPQLYAMSVRGGEARELTSFGPGLWDARYSPDGSFLVAVSKVFPECGADEDCDTRIADAMADGPLTVHVADELLFRHWTSWRDGRYTHLMLVDAKSGEVLRDLTPGPWDSPTFGQDRDGFDISPLGDELCYVSNHDPDPASSTNADIWVLPLQGDAEPMNLSFENQGHDGHPLFSPDGAHLAWLSQETPGYESDLYRLTLYDRRTGEIRRLTDRTNFDNWITDFRWAPDGKSIYFLADVPGRNAIYRIRLGDGEIEEIQRDHWIDGFELSPDGRSILFNQRAMDRPQELYSVRTNGKDYTRLTEFNLELENEVDLRPPEELWIDGAGDYQVHTFVIKPHDFDPSRRYPLILNVHGGPQGQWSDNWRGDWQVYGGKGYVIAMPNPTGSSGYGQDFTDAIGCDWGGRVYEDVMKVTEYLAQLPYIDPERIGVMGWSYGGYMVMWMQGHTDRFACSAAMMGLYDLPAFYGGTEELWFPERDLCGMPWNSEDYQRWSPERFEANFSTPSLVITGEKDFRVPYTQSLAYFTALQRQGIPSRLVVFPKAGHWPSWYEMAFYYNEHLAWFARYLGGGDAPYDPTDFSRNLLFSEED
jgi:dipeptidyl aminopeptidase/acylaminoacyl peptidase